MVKAPLPPNEPERLRALSQYGVLDTPPEPAFDRVTQLAARLFAAPMAFISLIDQERQWWKSCVGVQGTGTPRDASFCAHTILSPEPLVVEDATDDARFADNPFVTGAPGGRFYAGAPLINADGFALGTLCIADTRPRQLTSPEWSTLVDLARIVVGELELRRAYRALESAELRLERSEQQLAERVQLLEGILDSAGEGIVVADEEARFALFNPAARRIMGDAPSLGSRVGEPRPYAFLRPSDLEPCPAADLPLPRALRGEPSDDVELVIRRADTPDRRIRVTGRPLHDATGSPRGGIVTFNDITALHAAEAELAKLATTDQLTGVPNRRALDERLAQLTAEGARGRRFAVVLADIDHFKSVNDTFGHAVGDEVLARVAQVLQRHVRCTDLVARYGGEEFCVLFTDVDESQAWRLAENLRRALAGDRWRVPVTASFGLCANRPSERSSASALVETADRALYAAKSAGRNRVSVAQLSPRESLPAMFARAGA